MELRSDSLNPVLLGMGRGSLSLILVNPSLGYGYIVHSIHYSVEWALLSILNQRVNQRASFYVTDFWIDLTAYLLTYYRLQGA